MSQSYMPAVACEAVLDLSHWNAGEVDFAAMKVAGVAAVILKATQGAAMVDPAFVGRAMAAHAAGLLVGAYHFCDASPPAAQVRHFLGIGGALPVLALDIEPNGIGDTVTVPLAAEIAARVQMETKRAPLVYIGRWGPDGRGGGLPNEVLSRCPLWLPEYGGSPICPTGWNAWTFWQYTSAGSVTGITEAVDRSRFAGSIDDLTTWWRNA